MSVSHYFNCKFSLVPECSFKLVVSQSEPIIVIYMCKYHRVNVKGFCLLLYTMSHRTILLSFLWSYHCFKLNVVLFVIYNLTNYTIFRDLLLTLDPLCP